MSFENRLKRLVAEEMLGEYGRVVFVISADVGVVILPTSFLGRVVILDIWPMAPIPITDLEIRDDGWSATLSFDRSPFHCKVPWEAVRTIEATTGQIALMMAGPLAPPMKKREGLRLVKPDDAEEKN